VIVDAAGPDRTAFAGSFDACVIGAGPAGITLARRLAAAGAAVALMEAGGLEISAESQDAYAGRNVGLDYYELDVARLRYFGGTSNHWSGMCRNLDPYDFAPHPWHPLSGWPIGKADLDPYRAGTRDILELSHPVARRDRRRFGHPTRAPGPADAGLLDFPDEDFAQAAPRFRHVSFRYSPPVRFGEKYRAEIAASERIRLGLNANLVDLRLADDHGAVVGAVFRGYDPADPGFTVPARFYALCTGGIENPRLLLAFRSQEPAGIGNRHDLVGRFFCEHPNLVVADVLYERTLDARFGFYAPTPAFIAEQAILNVGLTLVAPPPPPPLGLGKATARSVACSADFLEALAEQVLGRPPGCERDGLGAWLARGGAPAPHAGRIETTSEQALDRASRVRLGNERDAFGLPRPELDWRLGELDYHTMRVVTAALGMHLAEQGIGRARVRDWLLAEPPRIPGVAAGEIAGWHHMCTTRMADDPRHGVVDRDCRVHGLANLYLGGSSVFATTGHANPTYTIVQLALRLGDHLTGRLHG
jgi:choline dehydrogenase-like flavoprotein